MKKFLFFVVALMITCFVSAQTIVFQENFESGTIGLTTTADSAGFPTTTFKAWAASSNLYKTGLKSDTNTLQNGKTIYFTSNTFSTVGNTFVVLEFSQICKLYFFDGGNVDVSIDGGTTWTPLGITQYLGTGTLIQNGGVYKFSESAYPNWLSGDTLTKPTNTWWKDEKFDISSIAANQANVKIRFKYTCSGNPSGAGRYGWLLDDIKVTAAPSELYPPVITMVANPIDTVYYGGPYYVSAFIKDASGIDTAYVTYKVGNGPSIQLGMIKSPTVDSLYTAGIPYVGYGRTVTYNITARDASGAHNLAFKPSLTGFYSFYTKYTAGGPVVVGAGTTNQQYPFKANADYAKSASIYIASAINRFGLITQLKWNVSTAQAAIPIPIKIYIKQTASAVMTADNWTNLTNGAVLVYDGIQTFLSTGWNTINLTYPFNYNAGNLMVLCEANNGTAATATPAYYYTSGTTGTHQYFASSASTTGSLNAQRPNITIGFVVSPLPTPDAGISQITNPTSSVIAGTAFPFNVKIKNFTTDSLKKANIYYTLDGGSAQLSAWTHPGLVKDSTYIYTVTNLNLAVGIHALKVWTDFPNDSIDQNFLNDTASYSFYACAGPMNGTYTVGGTGANFATFADVFVGLSQCGISGPVVFNINAGTYNDQLTIPMIVGTSAINTITFQSATNDSTSVIMNHTSTAAANWIIKLNGANFIAFKHIKFAPADPTNAAAVIITAGAANNKFIGNNFVGASGSLTSQTLLSIEGTTLPNKNNLIQGNYFFNGSYAISLKGTATATLKNTVVKNNSIDNSVVYGIYAQYVDSTMIDSNTINTSVVNTSSKNGIYLLNANVLNTVTKNTVIMTGGTNMYGILAENCVSTDTTMGLIANNFVSLLNGSNFAYGIRLNTVAKYKVYANSVITNGANALDTRAINIVSTSSGIIIKNNNLQGNVFTIHVEGASSVAECNYNNYYSTGTTFGYWNATAYNSMSSLVAASLKDSNSVNVNPFFLSTTNLHTFNGLLTGIGTNLADVTTDIDGAPRMNPPCIGADEFLPPAQDAALITILKPIGGCGISSTEDVKVVIKNVGSAAILSNTLTAHYKIDSSNAVVTELVNRSFNAGDTIHYVFTTKANIAVNPLTLADTTYKIRAWTDLTGDFAHSNDSSNVLTVSSMFTPAPPTATGATVFYSSTALLTAVSNRPTAWFDSPTSTTILHTGPSFTTPVLLATDTFYVAAKTDYSASGILGTGVVQNTNTGYPSPYGFFYNGCKEQYLITKAELNALGIQAGPITSIGFDVVSVTGVTALPNYTIKLGQTSQTALSAWISGLTQVYANPSLMPTVGWNLYSFTSPFVWNGTDNLVIEVCFNNNPNGYTYNAVVNQTATPFVSTLDYHADTDPAVCTAGIGTPSTYSQRPNIKIQGMVPGCESSRVPVIANVLSYAHEAGISGIIAPTGCGLYNVPISVKIFNHSYIDTLRSTNCTVKYKLDNGLFITPETINLIIKPFDTATYIFTTLANFVAPVGDRYIKVTAVVNTPSDAYNANDTLVKDSIFSRYTPPSPTANNVSIFNGSMATLTATAPGTIINWYDQFTGGVKIGEGSPYTTPFFMYVTDTFYVEANTSFSANGVIGNGTIQNSTTGYPTPYGQFYNGSKEQYLITKLELNALGFQAGPINSLGFDVVSYTGSALTNYTLKIGHSSQSGLSTWENGLTQVYTNVSYMPTTGWNIHTFTTPFVWNGIDNIVVENCFDNYPTGYTYNAIVNQTTTTFASSYYYQYDLGSVCTTGGSGSTATQRPNMKLDGTIPGCASSRTPVIVTVSPPPMNDAGVTTLVNPVGSTPSGVSTPIKVKIKNYGQAHLTSATVQWTLNGVAKPNYNFTGNISTNSDSTITIANETFSGGLYCVKAWTIHPNGAAIDSTGSNDTLHTVCFTACLNGNYTIGDTTGGNFHNFPTFNSAVNNLTVAGVCGPVTFLVDTGTYNEQVRISQIMGASAVNTITFRSLSNDSSKVKLQWAATTASNYYTLLLDSAKYITFKGITLKAIGVTYGIGVETRNTATNNIISNCSIQLPTGSSYSMYGIYDYGSASCFNTYQNNLIINGYYGIYNYGSSSSNLKPGNKIIGNKLLNFYYYGIFSYYQDSVQIIGNELNSSSASTYIYGLYTYYNQNASKILKNKIILSTPGSQYGLYVYYMTGTATAHGLVANNMVALSGGTTSSYNYGLYVYYSNYQDIYFNSVGITVPSPTNSRALYQYGGTFINLVDNILVNTGGGMAYYVGTPAAIAQSDYNNIYTTGSFIGYWTANVVTLNDLKIASSKDANSVSLDPNFTSATDLHLMSTILSTLGTPIALVSDDIDGFTRDVLYPTIGADEVPLLQHDAGVTFISRPTAVEIEATTFPVKVAVKNFGTNPITSVVVTYVLNGGTPVNFTFTPTNPILTMTTDSATFPANMTVPAGNNTICAYTTLVGDINTFNNQSCKSFFGIPLYDAQLALAYPVTEGCGLTSDTVKVLIVNQGALPINGGLTASYQRLGLPVVTETIATPIPVGGTFTYKFNQLVNLAVTTHDSLYKVKCWVTLTNDNVAYNNLDTIFVNSLHTPVNPVTSNITIPYATTGTINATSATADPLKWFDVPTGGTSIFTGSPYITPILFATDTFFVQSSTSSSFSAAIGTGISTQGYPFYGFWGYTRSASIYDNASVGGYGMINELQWNVATTASATFPVKIYLAQTNQASMTADTWTNLISNATLVYDGPQVFSATGWFPISLTTPWDYTSGNLMVLCEANYGGTGTTGAYFSYTTAGTGSHQYFYADNSAPAGTGYLNTSLPNIKISGNVAGCTSQRVQSIVTVGAQPALDASALSIVTPSSAVNLSNLETVSVLVKNYGSTAIHHFPVKYKLSHGLVSYPVVSQIMTDTIATDSVKLFTFTQTINLSSNLQPDTFKLVAWTDLVGDPTHQNDTTKKTVINKPPVYCISTATYTGDEDLGKVVFAGITHGNALPVLNNTAANQLYNNYTDSAAYLATLQPGMSYPISLSVIFSYGTYTGKVNAYIDYNRNGVWDLPDELAFTSMYDGSTNSTVTGIVNVPYTAIPGFTRLRIVVDEAANAPPCGVYYYGETEDYKVSIVPPIPHDGGISKMNGIGTFLPYTSPMLQTPQFFVRNYGSDSLSAATIKYVVNGAAPIIHAWTKTPALQSLESDSLFQSITLQAGMNTIMSYTSNITGDVNYLNDTLHSKVFKEYLAQPPYLDNFEVHKYWFATDTASGLTINNLWAQGVPTTIHPSLNAAHSPVNAWVTGLTANYPVSNLSILYSPVFDISVMQPDTLKFWQWRQFGTGTSGDIEYLSGNGAWLTLGIQNDTNATNWYNAALNNWTGVDTVWTQSKYRVKNLMNLGNTIQFRFRFVSGTAVSAMKGWAIDDFELSLASIPQDGGVIAITSPTATSLVGDLVTVSVTVKNFGTDILTNVPVKYQVGTGAIKSGIMTGSLAPGATGNFTFTQTFQVATIAYTICAYTAVVGDVYVQNDTYCKNVAVNPAQNDVGITQIILPGALAYAGTTPIKVEIKNFGTLTQTNIPLTYQRGILTPVNAVWTGSLAAGATTEFTFPNQMTVPSGLSFSLCAFTQLANDAYIHNDSICKSVTICNVATAGPITGPTTVTPGSTGNAYSITALANATSYNWVYTPSTGVTITPVGIGSSVTISFGAGATNGVLSCNGISSVCSGNPSSINISGLGAGINEFDAKILWLGQNVPNPTTGLTNIEYNLPTAGEIKFDIMNLFGQKVYSIQDKVNAGKHLIDLNVKDLSAGVYYYTIEFQGKRLVKKMVVNK
ncbi:MAG: GEVED domain-containing protein [Bacteroidota bacterium]